MQAGGGKMPFVREKHEKLLQNYVSLRRIAFVFRFVSLLRLRSTLYVYILVLRRINAEF